jgi:peroxiredoxin (alkyl hydroperoxide reductase subunit C)
MKIGDLIPDLEFDVFQDDEIKKMKFSDFKGKWLVIAFYPADFTFICPTELAELAGLSAEFKKQNAEILSMSADTAFVHKAWHETSPLVKKVKYPMGADPTHKICAEFGTLIEADGLSTRATFIINPEGIVKSMELHDNSIGRSAPEILRKLQASVFVSKNKGLVCPASWHPGSDTLKPSTKLVGKL